MQRKELTKPMISNKKKLFVSMVYTELLQRSKN